MLIIFNGLKKMRKIVSFMLAFGSTICASSIFAQDITGTWQHIDDKSGSPHSTIVIKKEENDTYSGTISSLRPDWTLPKKCVKCPAPYTNQPLVGMVVLKGLKNIDNTSSYEKGRIIDPLNGQIYDVKMKLNPSGRRLSLRAYMGASILGRNQTWIRIE